MPPFPRRGTVDYRPMAASPQGQARTEKQALAIVESGGTDSSRSEDPSAPTMAVSIAGVSTACSKDALASSAKAVRKTLASE